MNEPAEKMGESEVKRWINTIRMCEEDLEPRVKRWRELKKALTTQFTVPGTDDPVIISRFYKVLRDLIASVAFQHPHVYLSVEDEPKLQSQEEGIEAETLENCQPILENLVNDGLEIMSMKDKVRQIIFDAAFCFRGYGKILPPPSTLNPYQLSGAEQPDWTIFRVVRPENLLVDPLVQPEDFYSAGYVIERSFPALDAVANDPRFREFRREILELRGVSANSATIALDPDDQSKDDTRRQVLTTAHKLRKSRRMYEVHDRLTQRRIVFLDGIQQPIENIPHPLLKGGIEITKDPMDGRPLWRRRKQQSQEPREWLVWGGFQYVTLQFDVADEFYGDPIMAYENPIQNAIIRAVTREVDNSDRFKRLLGVTQTERENNKALPKNLKESQDGDLITFTKPDQTWPLEWPRSDGDTQTLQQTLLGYESELVGTTAGSKEMPDQATGQAIVASGMELNRNYNQAPVEELYSRVAWNMMKIMADPRYTPKKRTLRQPSEQSATSERIALETWHLQGMFNITIETGSSNILWESMQEDKVSRMVDRLRQSPNVDSLELDKLVIRAAGKQDPSKLLKKDANVDAAKAAELEIQTFFALLHDPGVTPGEDHRTHMALQDPNVVAQHPRFAQVPPDVGQQVIQIATGHFQAHEQAVQQEMSGGGLQPSAPAEAMGPTSILGVVQSSAQKTQDVLSKEAEEKVGA